MVLWLTFLGSVLAIVASTVVAVVRGLRLWRAAKSASSRFGGELERISSAAAEIQGHLDAADASAARLREASERLRRSRARLDVQLQALQEARTTLRRLVAFLPSG
jgi:chromosome segregation ATPase